MKAKKVGSGEVQSGTYQSSTYQSGSRWYCLFFGFYSNINEIDVVRIQRACGRFVRNSVRGDKRIFFEVDLSRSGVNLGTLQFKIQQFAETFDLPFQLWQWGVGRTLAESWVQTRWKSLTPSQLPIESLDDFLFPLGSPVTESKKEGLGSGTFHVLRCLGVSSLESLERMPHDLMLVRLRSAYESPELRAGLATPSGERMEYWMEEITAQSFLDDGWTGAEDGVAEDGVAEDSAMEPVSAEGVAA